MFLCNIPCSNTALSWSQNRLQINIKPTQTIIFQTVATINDSLSVGLTSICNVFCAINSLLYLETKVFKVRCVTTTQNHVNHTKPNHNSMYCYNHYSIFASICMPTIQSKLQSWCAYIWKHSMRKQNVKNHQIIQHVLLHQQPYHQLIDQ